MSSFAVTVFPEGARRIASRISLALDRRSMVVDDAPAASDPSLGFTFTHPVNTLAGALLLLAAAPAVPVFLDPGICIGDPETA